jgi:L-2-hydroxyglutarate oxidase LhgO
MFFDITIIGAGVVGLSIAKSCSEQGMSVVVLEKDARSGEGISSRNSGVIHAGIYYPNKSLKTKFCLSGNKLLYDYAKEKRINHKRIGKYIIASSKAEIEKLEGIYKKGILNSVTLNLLTKENMRSIYPDLNIEAGIYSPNTGIIDVPELINALEGDIQHNNGLISFNTKFISAKKTNSGFSITCDDGKKFLISSKYLINASGLNSDLISQQIDTLDKKHYSSIKYAKGHYFKYSGSHPFTTLVYPLASEFSSGLHVGFDLSGQIRFGPDITWVDNIDYSFDDSLKDTFMNSIKKYWPGIDSKKLQPDYVGIRPKLQNIDEKMKDFSICDSKVHGVEGLINIQGLESPGVTSSLAIGEYVKNMINSKDDPLTFL